MLTPYPIAYAITFPSRVYPDETNSLSAELKFLYGYSKSRESGFKFNSFQDLSNLLEANDIRFAAILLNIEYKDISESVIENESLYYAVLDIKKHTRNWLVSLKNSGTQL